VIFWEVQIATLTLLFIQMFKPESLDLQHGLAGHYLKK